MSPYRDLARLALINLLPADRQEAAVDAMLPSLAPSTDSRPVLIYAPPIDLRRDAVGALPDDPQQWADIAFRITSEGRVADVHQLRGSPHLDASWLAVATAAFEHRRYLPRAADVGEGGALRVARVTFIADHANKTGTRVATRNEQPRIDIVDLGPAVARD